MDALARDFPNDVEARALAAWAAWQQRKEGAPAIEQRLRDVLRSRPDHPAAHHFRIHLWDENRNGERALDSCRAYPNAAPAIGHAQHMPGHVYAQLGRFADAANAMDRATRAERRYFFEQKRLPFHSWNFSHNQEYLVANLGYLGRIREGEALARELLDLPRDPKHNRADDNYGIAGDGRTSLLRMRVRGERWDEILADHAAGTACPTAWPDNTDGRAWNHYALGLAQAGKGNIAEARKHADALAALFTPDSSDKPATAAAAPRPSAARTPALLHARTAAPATASRRRRTSLPPTSPRKPNCRAPAACSNARCVSCVAWCASPRATRPAASTICARRGRFIARASLATTPIRIRVPPTNRLPAPASPWAGGTRPNRCCATA
jgi:tetratricopeptide (TPR) repeat protein